MTFDTKSSANKNTRSHGHSKAPAIPKQPAVQAVGATVCPRHLGNNLLQKKLSVGASNDAFEQEADRVADKITNSESLSSESTPMITPVSPASNLINRKCASCEQQHRREEEREGGVVQREPEHSATVPELTPAIQSTVEGLQGRGEPLSAALKHYFEPRFGYDFSSVRVHNGGAASDSARSLQAKAYTHNNNIVFGAGHYAPQTRAGKHLVAHELTHVVQQQSGRIQRKIQREKDPDAAQRSVLSQELIPTATIDISLEGVYFNMTSQAVFQVGPKTIQLIRIALKTLIKEQYTDALASELTTLIEKSKKKYARYGHFKDSREAYANEKIKSFGFAIDPFLLIKRFIESKKLKLYFDDSQFASLSSAYANKHLWADMRRLSKSEKMRLPRWYSFHFFTQQMKTRKTELDKYRDYLLEYESTKDDSVKYNGLEMANTIFYEVYDDIAFLEAIRKDVVLYKNPITQGAYQAVWGLTEKLRKKNKPARGLRSINNAMALLNFAAKNYRLKLNSETQRDARVELLSKFVMENGIPEENITVLPPYPSYIASADINKDNTTITTATNTFRMGLKTHHVHGNDLLHGASIAMARHIAYSWDVVPLPDSLTFMRDKTAIPPVELAKEADQFVKNSPQNLKTPIKTFKTDGSANQSIAMKHLGIGEYLLVGRAAPHYKQDMNWVQHASAAGHPFFVYDASTLAHNTAFTEWDQLASLKAKQAKATDDKKKGYQDDIDRLEQRESSGLLSLTQKDIEDTTKLMTTAKKLRQFIVDDRAKKLSSSGDASTDPFIIRLKNHDRAQYDVYNLIREMYSPRQYSDLTAIDEYVSVLQKQNKQLTRLGIRVGDAQSRFKPGYPALRVVAALVKKDDGNVVPLMLVAGYHPDADPENGNHKMKLVDVTFDAPKKGDMIYVGGTSSTQQDAVQSAFVKFGEDNKYGNGKIVYRLPQTSIRGTSNSVTTFFEYLEYALAALGIIMLVAGTIATAGALSPAAAAVVMALGVSLAVISAAMSIRNMNNRKEKGTLELDTETALDIINIIGAVVVVVGTLTKVTLAARTATLSRMLTVQRLDRLIAIYDVTELGANIYLLNAKVKEDIDAIKKLRLPKDQEANMIASVTYSAIQQGAMMGISAYSTLRQIPDVYQKRVEGSAYQSWLEKGWIKMGSDNNVEITNAAPPFLRKNKPNVGTAPAKDQQGVVAKMAVKSEPLTQIKTVDKEHTLTLTERGRIIRCSDLCQDLRAKYQRVVDADPDLHQQLLKIEAKALEASSKGNKVLAAEALAEARSLESVLKAAQVKATAATPTPTPARPRTRARTAPAATPTRSPIALHTPDELRLITQGRTLGMLDTEVDRFIEMFRRLRMPVDEMSRQMDQWASTLRSYPNAKFRLAPDFILDPASRARLPDFDQRIAGTGGIESIVVRDAPNEGGIAITIAGIIFPRRLARKSKDVTATRRRAPEFNSSGNLFSVKEAGLNRQWQRLHLWGPGFGDEAAAGMMWGPRKINLVWQNDSVESYIRQLATITDSIGGRTRVKATAISWENPTPSGWRAPQGDNFLKRVQYEITLERPGQPNTTIRVTIDVAEPPNPDIKSFGIDPAHAVNLGDLLD
ncbi:eCIS core domain-containing protein [Teredinibacter purpureus]|uniref:eCIS core domain-containing protein n=1 Tax=Teredinibacter purpureus TaxID=2731756 RepID=UPI0005F877B3|nr:DUF4157 domain-containing protein [Teredinibacter purpureus]